MLRMSINNIKILITRTDRIGDLVLSTPVFEALKKHIPQSYIIVMAKKDVINILNGNPFIDEMIMYDPSGVHKGLKGALELADTLREKRIDIAVELFMSFYPALAISLAGIKMRIGPGSRIYSSILLTHVIKQERKQSKYNEALYNLMLLKPLGIEDINIKPRIYLSDNKDSCEKFLLNNGLKPFGYVVVHPGMGGSAKNWSAVNYASLIGAITRHLKLPVLITGSNADLSIVKTIMGLLKPDQYIKNMCCVLSLEQLKTIMFFSKAVVGPSTGPMHIAAALYKPTIALFSPLKAQSKVRWAPYLLDNVSILSPNVVCDKNHCYNKCIHYDCMNIIKVQDVIKYLEGVIEIQ